MKMLLLFFIVSTQLVHAKTQTTKTIHVFVALCDNFNQGISPVPEQLGNEQDPDHNLYWGAGYGVKTFLKKSKDWIFISSKKNVDSLILERVLFKHKHSATYLLADAYNGAYIQNTIIDFTEASAGRNGFEINEGNKSLCFGGDSNLLSYVGYNGLMEFDITGAFQPASSSKIETIILACYSKHYFSKYLQKTKAQPLLWTTHLMAPEAYTLKYAIDGWINKEENTVVAEKAAQAYNKYQKCGITAARKLLVTGF